MKGAKAVVTHQRSGDLSIVAAARMNEYLAVVTHQRSGDLSIVLCTAYIFP